MNCSFRTEVDVEFPPETEGSSKIENQDVHIGPKEVTSTSSLKSDVNNMMNKSGQWLQLHSFCKLREKV